MSDVDEQVPSGPRQWFFDIWSRFYDLPLVQRTTYRPVQDVVVAELDRRRPDRTIVDIGCGTGILASRLADSRRPGGVVGCDYSAGMLEQAAQRDTRVSWVQADAQSLPLADASAGAICCTESFHWYPDQPKALREFRRVLAPGGVLLLAVVNPSVELVGQTVNRFSQVMGQPMTWSSPAHLVKLVEDAGFEVENRIRVRRVTPGLVLPTIVTVAV